MTLYDYNGGSGTASRQVEYGDTTYTVGVFVQANFGSREELAIAGKPVGLWWPQDNPQSESSPMPPGAGSVIVVIATDAPLMPPQCKAMARRATLGLARTGTTGSHFSGDLFLAFSTGNAGAFSVMRQKRETGGHYDSLTFIPWEFLDPFFAAVVEAVEEAVIDVLVVNDEMTGYRGHRIPALPREKLAALFQ
jgi:L-aminopeptidase/D-esterase-like protein